MAALLNIQNYVLNRWDARRRIACSNKKIYNSVCYVSVMGDALYGKTRERNK